MSERDVITFPGPGGSRVSCCIIPIGCLLLLLVGFLVGGAALALRWHSRSVVARLSPTASAVPAVFEKSPAGR